MPSIPFIDVIAETTIGVLMEHLIAQALKRSPQALGGNKDRIQTALEYNLESTYEKCISIKTILSEKKERFQDIYTTQKFRINDTEIDHVELSEFVNQKNSIVIIGTGGGGKSMFMRYLWLSFFAQYRDRFPIFVDLRQLNAVTHESIEDYIFHSIVTDSSKVKQSDFTKSLRNGDIILFLDGFDEIFYNLREKYERSIIALKERYPKLDIVVTSRPDDRFHGWHQFNSVHVEPLKIDDTVELLSSAPYDEQEKRKLISKIRTGLFDSHESFLSNPLLAYMMLVTFSYDPDIPSRMFQFYEQAFEALYHRHDLTKSGFKRKFYSELSKQDFKRLFSYFCLISYYDENFEFSVDSLNSYIDRARSMENVELNNDLFIRDLMESVCLLKKDGIEFNFTHRSFQEYFAAYCIARVSSRSIEKLFLKFSNRWNDEVLGMVYDINKDLFREKYIYPFYEKNRKFFSIKEDSSAYRSYLRRSNMKFNMRLTERVTLSQSADKPKRRDMVIISFENDREFNSFEKNLLPIAEYYTDVAVRSFGNEELDIKFLKNCIRKYGIRSKELRGQFENGSWSFFEILDSTTGDFRPVDASHVAAIRREFRKSRLHAYFIWSSCWIRNFVNDEIRAFDQVTQRFEDLVDGEI